MRAIKDILYLKYLVINMTDTMGMALVEYKTFDVIIDNIKTSLGLFEDSYMDDSEPRHKMAAFALSNALVCFLAECNKNLDDEFVCNVFKPAAQQCLTELSLVGVARAAS